MPDLHRHVVFLSDEAWADVQAEAFARQVGTTLVMRERISGYKPATTGGWKHHRDRERERVAHNEEVTQRARDSRS